MPKYFLLIISLLLVITGLAQNKQGSWQDYLSYTNATKIAVSSENIFCATEGGLSFYDMQDNSVNKLSELVELSDFGIKTIAYNEENKVLIIAYNNSNIDLVYESRVINLSDIKRKPITGDKSINNISFFGKEAYLSCGFGIVVINLERNEVKDTYLIGDEGAALRINDIDFLNNFIYAATDEGILFADSDDDNLLDYRNWTKVENIPHFNQKFSQIEIHAGKLVVNYTPAQQGDSKLYIQENNNWSEYLQQQIDYTYDIQTAGEYMIITARYDIFVVDNSHTIIGKIHNYQFGDSRIETIRPRSAGISNDGIIWIADYEYSFIKVSGENFESILPNGPMDNDMFSLHQFGQDLWVAPGGTIGWEIPRFQRLKSGQWNFFTKSNFPELDNFNNIISIVIDPFDENHFFAASWGGGLLEYKNDEFVQRYTNKNSPLESALPDQPDEPYVRIGGMDFDSDGNLWMSNAEVAHNLHKLSAEGEWNSYVLPEIANLWNTRQLIVTENNDKWIIVPSGHDAYVVDESGAQKKRLLVTSYFNNGENEIFNRMNDIYAIVEDNEGAIWLGTSKGVAVYNNPSRIWSSDNFYASQPSLDLEDGIYHPLLGTETVTAIAVDGANRKWFGTKNSGVYLISESGETEILHFTEENSPLFSNEINSIAINQKSGEVYFGTADGLISYQGDAISGKDTYNNVYAFPNPVRETYDGPITVTGLIENTDVKITDISGNLIFKTTSLGGQATWDGTNLNGNRVKTGVYLVFCNDETGEETQITKLLFIH